MGDQRVIVNSHVDGSNGLELQSERGKENGIIRRSYKIFEVEVELCLNSATNRFLSDAMTRLFSAPRDISRSLFIKVSLFEGEIFIL